MLILVLVLKDHLEILVLGGNGGSVLVLKGQFLSSSLEGERGQFLFMFLVKCRKIPTH